MTIDKQSQFNAVKKLFKDADLIINACDVTGKALVIFLIVGLIVTVAFNMLELKAFIFSCFTICIIGIITSLIVKPSNY